MVMNSKKNTSISKDKCGSSERYYDFGLHHDLCGMSIKDYIESNKHCCPCCDDDPNNDPSTPSKKINTIIFTTNSEGYLIAYTTYAPTTTITVSCLCNNERIEFVFNANTNTIVKSNVIPNGEKIEVLNVTFNPSEDDSYKYGDYLVENKHVQNETLVFIPNKNVNFNDLSLVSTFDLTETKVDNDGTEIKFSFTATNDLPENFYDEDFDYESWRSENSYVPVLFLEKEKFDDKLISIYVGSSEITNYFTQIATKQINNTVYSVLVKTTNDTNAQYLEYNGLWVNTYSADTDTNIEYIIKEQK